MSTDDIMVPALCSVTFRSLSVEELIPLARENGVKAIEWGADVHVPLGQLDRARQVAALCKDQDIDAASYGSYVRAGDPAAIEQFSQALDTAQALGAGNIRVWAGRRLPEDYNAAERQGIAADLHRMADVASGQGITVSIEFHRNTLTQRVQDAVVLLEEANHPNLFSYWQPVPDRPLQTRLEEMTALAPWLGHVHVFHWIPVEDQDERRPLSEGRDLWQAMMNNWTTAPHWPHPRLAMLEFVANDDIEQFRKDMHTLRKLCTACPTHPSPPHGERETTP